MAATWFVDLEALGKSRAGTMIYYRHPGAQKRTRVEVTEDAWGRWVAARSPSTGTATGGRWYIKMP